MSKISDLMDQYVKAGSAERERLIDEAEKLAGSHSTYMFTFTPDAKLAVIEAVMPTEDAVAATGKTIKLFGWREGIMQVIETVQRYLDTHHLDNAIGRIALNSRPKQMPDGNIYQACAACGYSPAADRAMWLALIAALDKDLENPPE